MRGCHLPLLYIGLEYSLTNNQQYAERFFSQVGQLGETNIEIVYIPSQALEIAPHDPFVLHELGVTAFQSGQYEVAEKYFFPFYDHMSWRTLTNVMILLFQVAEKYLRDALLKVEAVCKGGGEEMVRCLHSLNRLTFYSLPSDF